MVTSRLLFRRGPGFPWAVALLALGCVVTTLPMLVDERYYLVLGVGHERADNPHVRGWHALVTPFVHGGGFPGAVAHLLINGAYLVVLGSVIERALGRGRYMALALACLLAETLLAVARGRYAHGLSAVVWSHALFAPALLAHAWRAERARALRDPCFLLVALLAAVGVVGLVNKWHALSVAVGAPFLVRWQGLFRGNLERIERGEAPDRWGASAEGIGLAAAALLCAFTCAMTLGAVLGWVR